MIASLPMYDRPELRAETDRFWALIRDALRAQDVAAPDDLDRGAELWDTWTDPALVLSQTCGLPFRTTLHEKVTLVAAPHYGLPGCGQGEYNSVIVTRGAALPEAPRAAVNGGDSQSGWGALWSWALGEGIELGPRIVTGAHANSARLVRDGGADIAAIDAHTWRLLCRYEPWAAELTEIGRTHPTPATPFITAGTNDPAPYRAALNSAVAALDPADRRALDLIGVFELPVAAYMAIPIPPAP